MKYLKRVVRYDNGDFSFKELGLFNDDLSLVWIKYYSSEGNFEENPRDSPPGAIWKLLHEPSNRKQLVPITEQEFFLEALQ
jgi:hypothetical protein